MSTTAVLTKQSLLRPEHTVIGSSDLYMCAEAPRRIMKASETKSPATAPVSRNARALTPLVCTTEGYVHPLGSDNL